MTSIVLFKNIALSAGDTGAQTSSVGEPSVANNGREIFVSGNWYATKSLDAAASWSFIDLRNLLPPAAAEFCCDQVVLYDPSRNLLFWLLQYARDPSGTNVLRLAVKEGGTLGTDAWFWWDFSPAGTNASWAGEWFDYPDLELSDNFLYITSNVYAGDKWRRSIVLRLPLDALAARGQLSYEYFSTTLNGSLRCVRGATTTMYFASNSSSSRTQIRVFRWLESENRPMSGEVNVAGWNEGPYEATGPDGTNWLQRCDGRITGAWIANERIGVAWSVNTRGTRPYPYVRAVEIEEGTMQVVADRDIWNPNYAYAYPNGCPNDRGEIGITLFRGGNQINPGHVVGIWNEATNRWELRATKGGTDGPADNKWGDYLTCRRYAPEGRAWIASGYTLQGGGARANIEPRVVVFGREGDRPTDS
jgi:hypothetical protein